ncbi:hypothetical protein GCM10009122_12920 [Fulvivirga kasyanovii]
MTVYLFLHIRITKDQFIFKNEAIDGVRSWLPEVSLFDIDNHSDTTTIQAAIKAMEMAEKVYIQIEAEPETELGGTLKILNQVMKKPSAVIDYQGRHDTLDKILVRFKDKLVAQDIQLPQKVVDFFNG